MTKSSCWQITKKLECFCYFGLGNKQKAYRQFRGVSCYVGVLTFAAIALFMIGQCELKTLRVLPWQSAEGLCYF